MADILRYTRVVGTDDEGSAFEDAELHLNEQVADGAPALFVGVLGRARGVAFVRIASFHSEPHPAAETQWVVVLRGVIEVQVSDGTARQFGPGDLVLATDTSGRGHITRVVGDPPFEALSIPSIPTG
jgi:quercetin dioxygenase-like cupin family protein